MSVKQSSIKIRELKTVCLCLQFVSRFIKDLTTNIPPYLQLPKPQLFPFFCCYVSCGERVDENSSTKNGNISNASVIIVSETIKTTALVVCWLVVHHTTIYLRRLIALNKRLLHGHGNQTDKVILQPMSKYPAKDKKTLCILSIVEQNRQYNKVFPRPFPPTISTRASFTVLCLVCRDLQCTVSICRCDDDGYNNNNFWAANKKKMFLDQVKVFFAEKVANRKVYTHC